MISNRSLFHIKFLIRLRVTISAVPGRRLQPPDGWNGPRLGDDYKRRPGLVLNSPANLTKQTLGNRSYINQLAFAPSDQTTAMVGTNDGNVQIGFGMGTGAPTATW